MLLAAELPGFVRGNPPSSTSSATVLPLAPEARQFFLTGEPEITDRYFPWLVNLMSPAYWVYLVMAVTIPFYTLKALSPLFPSPPGYGPREVQAAPPRVSHAPTTPPPKPELLPPQRI